MNQRLNRKAIALSAIVTTVVLVGIGAATFVANPTAVDANTAHIDGQTAAADQTYEVTSAQTDAAITTERAPWAAGHHAHESVQTIFAHGHDHDDADEHEHEYEDHHD